METLRFLLVTTFYPPYHLGGDAVHVEYLARALAGRGHEVHVGFAPAAYRVKRREEPRPRAEAESSVQLHPIPSPWRRAQPLGAYVVGRSRSVTRFHRTLVRDLRPDVIHLHNISLLGLGVLDAGPKALRLYTAHDYWVRCPRNDLFKYGRFPCDTRTCVRCSLISRRPPQLWRRGWTGLRDIDYAIAPSQFMARALEGWTTARIVHIPNFAPDPNPQGSIEAPGDDYLFVGVLEAHKGILELASAVTSRPYGIRLTVVGRGPLEGALMSLTGPGRARLSIRGWLPPAELATLYPRARALLLPSLSHDNSPLAAIEALAWGTPLLVSRRGGLEELLDGGETGRSFDPRPADILTSIEQFEREGLAEGLRKGARRAYEKHYRPEHYLDRYRSLLDERGKSDEAIPRAPGGLESSGNPGSM